MSRALFWCNPVVMGSGEAAKLGQFGFDANVPTLFSAIELRKRTNMANKVSLFTIGHPLGALHLKIIICGNDKSRETMSVE